VSRHRRRGRCRRSLARLEPDPQRAGAAGHAVRRRI